MAERHLLHASRIAWDDVAVECEVPADMIAVANALRAGQPG